MVSVIGGGPIGSYIAARNKVRLFEYKKEIGKPVKCTGLISRNLDKLMKVPKEIIQNKVRGAKIYFPNFKKIEIDSKKEIAYVINRELFDKALFNMANKKSEIVNEKVIDVEMSNEGNVIIKTDKNIYEDDYVIGADGVNSVISKKFSTKNNYITGIQARVKLSKDKDFVELYLNNAFAPGFFAWVVPENEEICKVGVATKANTNEYFKRFLRLLNNPEIIDYQGGMIPIDYKENIYGDKWALVGDAASQVKATTGGGIVFGLESAKILSNALKEEELDFFSNYFLPWKISIGKELKKHWILRKFLNNLDTNSLNELYYLVKDYKEIIEEKGDMDFISSLLNKDILKGLIKNKRFIKFSLKNSINLIKSLF